MSNEARVNTQLQITKGNLQYRSSPTAFLGDVTGAVGPTPGAIEVPITGVDVDFSVLTTPGYCRIYNFDDTNFIIWGAHDGTDFYPLGEVRPGESYVLRLYRYLGGLGTGTGTTVKLHLMADTATCYVAVEAFEA